MMTLSIAISLVLAAATPVELKKQAEQLSAEGQALYKEGKLEEAEEKFGEAARLSPRLAVAHYNHAALASLRLDDCGGNSPFIVQELEASIALEPSWRAEAQKDARFARLRATVAYQLLFGASLKTRAGLRSVVSSVEWHHGRDDESDSGAGLHVAFLPTGKLKHEERDSHFEWVTRLGTWKVAQVKSASGEALQVVLDVPEGGGLPALHEIGTVTPDGRMLFDTYWLVDGPIPCNG